MYTLFILAVYTLAVLLFVPLDKIGRAQKYIKAKVKTIRQKVDE